MLAAVLFVATVFVGGLALALAGVLAGLTAGLIVYAVVIGAALRKL